MLKPVFPAHRQHLEAIFKHALGTVDPFQLVASSVKTEAQGLKVGEATIKLSDVEDLYLIALGKAAGGMTQAFLETSRLQPKAGIIALPRKDQTSFPPQFTVYHTGHPHPNQASLQAGKAARQMLGDCGPRDLLIVLISGGGSAMFELPISGITLDDLHRLNQQLLGSGLSILEMNIIRSAVSQVKAGGLARLAHPARVLSIILSDVVGDRLGSIASGPTVLLSERRSKALELLRQKDLWPTLPESVRVVLERPAPQRQSARRPTNVLIGSNRQLVDAAALTAQRLGFRTSLLSRRMTGEARTIGENLARRMIHRSHKVEHPTCFIMGGESTVRLVGSGTGGRNQELALAAALILDGHERLAIASLASDGIDGPTDAAGGIVNGDTCRRIQSSDLDPEQSLLQNDSYPALRAADALYRSGPTGTNVADLVLGLIFPEDDAG